jgi:uncharacterized protein (DUF58 family)
MIAPTRRGVAALIAALPLALLPALVSARLWPVWAAAMGASLGALAMEWLLGRASEALRVEVRTPDALYIGERGALIMKLPGAWARATAIEILCDFDPLLAPQGPVRASAGPNATGVPISLVPVQRGVTTVQAVWLRWRSPFGLLQWTARQSLLLPVPILPNLHAVRGAALRFSSSRQFLAGPRLERYVGDGSEFESLREHVAGFDTRAIDWKSSARHRKLFSREYRAERNHAVVIALDTGRLMSEPMLGIPKVDHAVNASLLLAWVALKTGDRVGLFAFDERVRQFSEPQGGVRAFDHLRHQTAGIAYSHAETNFTSCLMDLSQRLRRRTLIVALTDFVDTVTAELMIENLSRLGRNHLVLFVALRDPSLDNMVRAEPINLTRLNRSVSAYDLVQERDVVLGRLRRRGVHCIDTPPGEISSRVVNSYLDAKRRELL